MTSINPDSIRADLEAAGVMFVQSPDGEELDMFVLNGPNRPHVAWGQQVEEYDLDYCLGDVTGVGVTLLEFNHMFDLLREQYTSGPSFACAVAMHIGWMGRSTSM